jgi:hypothetical protein
MKRIIALLAMASLAVASIWASAIASAQAAPLAAADVAAGAKWLLHIDFDAARESKLGEHFRAKALEDDHAQKVLAKLHDDLGLDPQKVLHGATAYGTDFAPHSGVVIFYATADKEKLLSYLKAKPGFETSKTADGDHDVYSWNENMGKGDKRTFWASFPKTGVGVLSESAESLKAALDVIGGKGGLASDSPLLADAPKGTFLRGGIVGLTAAKLPNQMQLVRQIDEVNLSAGENDGEDFIHVKVQTTADEAPKQIKSILDGFRNMIGLQAGKQREAQKMLDGLKIDAKDKLLTIDWEASSDDVIKLADKAREAARQRRQNLPRDDRKIPPKPDDR